MFFLFVCCCCWCCWGLCFTFRFANSIQYVCCRCAMELIYLLFIAFVMRTHSMEFCRFEDNEYNRKKSIYTWYEQIPNKLNERIEKKTPNNFDVPNRRRQQTSCKFECSVTIIYFFSFHFISFSSSYTLWFL